MCAIVEEYAAEREKEAVNKANQKALIKGFKSGLTKEMAKAMYPKLKLDEIESLYQQAKKTTRSRKAAQ